MKIGLMGGIKKTPWWGWATVGLLALVPLLWFRGDLLINGGDLAFPMPSALAIFDRYWYV